MSDSLIDYWVKQLRYVFVLVAVLLLIAGLLVHHVYADVISQLTVNVTVDGKVAADAVVEFWQNGTLILRGFTDSNGTVTFTNVSTGEYIVYIYWSGYAWSYTVLLTNTTTSLSFDLTTPSTTTTSTNTTTTNTNTTTTNTTSLWVKIKSNPYYMAGVVAGGFIILLLIAYGLSGGRVPRRR